ncbi:MAG: DNA-directed RNA polymerase subunit L [Sulfolobales archaeon]
MSIDLIPRIKIEKRSDRELIFTLTGDQHGIPNLISKLAIRKPYVSYAAYIVDHPQTSQPRVVIITDGTRDPVDVLIEILIEAKTYAQNLKEAIEKLL